MGKAVAFTPENLPSGIEANSEQTTTSPMTKAVMEINISAQVSTGEYTFNIRVEIDGKDYGQVPCTIKVIN
jgi:c-di-GMP-binding flagellar brake protein YcgR